MFFIIKFFWFGVGVVIGVGVIIGIVWYMSRLL